MLFAIISEDVSNSLELRMKARPAHLARLQILADKNRLFVAGPHPKSDGSEGFTGSLVIADFDTFEEATLWADADPYIEAGVYAKVVVKPFKAVLP